MPKVHPIEFALYAVLSLLIFLLAGLAISHRPSSAQQSNLRDKGWGFLYLGVLFSIKAMEQGYPYPQNNANPYAWASGLLALVTLYHAFWLWRKKLANL